MTTIKNNFSLLPFNTFKIDCKAQWFANFNSVDELEILLSDAKFNNFEKLILGGGSNILLTKDFDGLVLKNEMQGIEKVNETDQHVFIKAAAGVVWHQFVMDCIAHNWAGLENLSLIPGCVGASPIQNIGAYGVELKDVFHSLEAYSMADKKMLSFGLNDCEFGYRDSVFKRHLKNKMAITSVTFKLSKQPVFKTTYGAIEQELEKMGIANLSIKAISQAVVNIRSAKLPNPAVLGNAGSFFKNPEIDTTKFEQLKADFPSLTAYALANGNYKLAAGWLIEQCGWKGKTIGRCGVHQHQALVIVNYGGATGAEIFDLSTQVMQSVLHKFGVMLEREVNIL